MSKTRRFFTPEQKAEVVRRHLSGKEAVSDLADEFGIQPTLVHNWVNQVLAQAERALSGRPPNGGRRTPGSRRSPGWKPSLPTRTRSSPS